MNKIIQLICWLVGFQTIGIVLGLVTQDSIYPWYQHLNKSTLTPPGFVFSIAWTLLYALLAIIAWILSNDRRKESKKIKRLFALQMLMNWAWTFLFFGLHWITISTIWLLGLTFLNVILLIETKYTYKTIALLLIPYTVWLMFASYLNVVIALLN